MRLQGVRVGFSLTGSHCTLAEAVSYIQTLTDEGANIFPVISQAVNETNTRYGSPAKWKESLREVTGNDVISSISDAEPIGPGSLLDIMVVAPCTGNTLAKLANGIVDGPVLMAVKATLRNSKPVVLAISTNDGLGMNARNLGALMNTKNIFMVPFGQDNPENKPNSLIAKMNLIADTVYMALQGKQIQPLLITF
ncbi:MAG: Dipicolinic acid synthetase, B subunit [Desulfotomaculum sp. 46_296]|nr:MAG: Dipicolinic acid synthetase, B subunit [Desulfotomaculum sp. 46_296]KUK84885.1 MAG: Dipicolinic acid synthetase, B subunit [Desulfofundulus kuznetsovii]HAU31498.1 dipicolinate synthase subunit B [Desulfotomaculum sp.]